MSEMIERVARAIFEARWQATENSDWTDAEFEKQARAAIEAMREPTDAILDISTMSISHSNKDIWQAMIDAALK